MKKIFLPLLLLISSFSLFAQQKSNLPANEWVDSVFNTLSKEEKIAQLMIIRAHSNLGAEHINQVTELINRYNVGGLIFFQGGPIRQANLTNYYQSIAKTPLLISIDGEWGLGMRLDSVVSYPRQLMLGAVPDAQIVYKYGKAVGEQCKRLGIHINFAPVVDVNNNPENPVINDRSFGEDKYKVALYGIQYMKGMQDVGVLACAKHFPGHGDVNVDSHYDLPVINKSLAQLESLELYPFREIFKAGVGSVMIAHLYIPAIDNTANRATSLSYNNVTGLLRDKLGYNGLTFTDALEMKGVAKFFPAGEAAVQSLIAGNDMLCLPGDVPGSIEKILEAIKDKKLDWNDINHRVKKVLYTKYKLGLNSLSPVKTNCLTTDINESSEEITKLVAQNALTLLKNENNALPLKSKRIAYLGVGLEKENEFSRQVKKDLNADFYPFSFKKDLGTVSMLAAVLKTKYDLVIIGLHNYSRRPANNFGLSNASVELINMVQKQMQTATFVFGNPYAIKQIESSAKCLVACYEDDNITQQVAADLLQGKISPKGKLPVTVSETLPFGTGITRDFFFERVTPEAVGLKSEILGKIDSIATDGIAKKAFPGCVVLVAKDGKLVVEKTFGYTNYDSVQAVNKEMVYDLASVTKISATTISVMKLYEEGLIDLDRTLGHYLYWVRGTNKENLTIRNVLLHQAGLVAWIPFYKETIDSTGKPLPNIYRNIPGEGFNLQVAENLYMRNDWVDTMRQRIIESKVSPEGKYLYSDNDFIFLGKIVEAVSGKILDEYAAKYFYRPLGMSSTTFNPLKHFPASEIAPTENEKQFRMQLLDGYVHDPGAAMFGGVAGHAGLFSNAFDLYKLYSVLLNGGTLNGKTYFKKETIELFTAYNSDTSRRGLGFDKPEKDNENRKEPYPAASASSQTYGHTGFTGTCVWVDPQQKLVYIFLSNRVTPDGGENTRLLKMNIRGKIQDIIYEAMK